MRNKKGPNHRAFLLTNYLTKPKTKFLFKNAVHVGDFPAVAGVCNGYVVVAYKIVIFHRNFYDGNACGAFNN